MRLLTVNAGSSNTKLALFEAGDGAPVRIGKAQAIRDGDRWRLAFDGEDAPPQPAGDDPQAALLAAIDAHWPLAGIDAIGHRVVHGGTRFRAPARVDAGTLDALRELEPLAPLHQPANLAMIDAVTARLPAMPQVASFDTAFHATLPEHAWRFAIPHALAEAGIRRYGFHGLSYQSIRDRLRARAPGLARGRVVVAHLGAGCSACAMRDGVSLDTSMGFSALDGLPMATRCGALDPGVLLHLMQQHGMDARTMHDMLYRESGLRGLSAISGDVRELIDNDNPRAAMALQVFAFRVAREIGALAIALGGLDGVVFTAGVGEHQPRIRRMIADHLGAFGARVDDDANLRGEGHFDAEGSGIQLWMLHTDEEAVIAQGARDVLAG
ncbi:acetate/propionate family kinase [Thermomonas brevis]